MPFRFDKNLLYFYQKKNKKLIRNNKIYRYTQSLIKNLHKIKCVNEQENIKTAKNASETINM